MPTRLSDSRYLAPPSMPHIFIASISVATVASLICWAMLFLALPKLRHAHHAQFVAAGRPSLLTWTLLRFPLLGYLLSNMFHSIDDPRLVLQLRAIRALWIVGLFALGIALTSAFAYSAR